MKTMKEIWNESSELNRKKLLNARGLHPSFAKVSDYDDLSRHSGNHVKHSLDELYSEWRKLKKI